MEKEISKQDKLQHCARLVKKPLQVLAQLDGFLVEDPNILDPDENGLAACGREAEELFNGVWDMRVFIKPETSREKALGLLDKMRDWIAHSKEWRMFIEDKQDRPALALQLKPRSCNAPCKLCGADFYHRSGPGLFLAGTELLACCECGRKHEPKLVEALLAYRDKLRESDLRDDHIAPIKSNASNGIDDDTLPLRPTWHHPNAWKTGYFVLAKNAKSELLEDA